MMLTTEQRRALVVLTDTGRDGAAEAIMAARFGVEVLAGLVRKGGRASTSKQWAPAAVLLTRRRITVSARAASPPPRRLDVGRDGAPVRASSIGYGRNIASGKTAHIDVLNGVTADKAQCRASGTH
jgi:hypothetical protein